MIWMETFTLIVSGIRPFVDKYKNSTENGDWILKDSKQNGHQSVSIQNILMNKENSSERRVE